MSVKRLYNERVHFTDNNGALANGYRLFFYAAGSSTKQNTFTDSTGATPNSNPVTLNARGEPATEIWVTDGLLYKIGFAIPGTDDPPASFIWTEDNISGMTGSSIVSEWTASGFTPTFISTTQFSVSGDQRATLQVGRRLQIVNTGGTFYGYISVSSFGASITTVTVVADTGSPVAILDVGISAVAYSFLNATNPSIPQTISVVESFTGNLTFSGTNNHTGTETFKGITTTPPFSGGLIAAYQNFT